MDVANNATHIVVQSLSLFILPNFPMTSDHTHNVCEKSRRRPAFPDRLNIFSSFLV